MVATFKALNNQPKPVLEPVGASWLAQRRGKNRPKSSTAVWSKFESRHCYRSRISCVTTELIISNIEFDIIPWKNNIIFSKYYSLLSDQRPNIRSLLPLYRSTLCRLYIGLLYIYIIRLIDSWLVLSDCHSLCENLFFFFFRYFKVFLFVSDIVVNHLLCCFCTGFQVSSHTNPIFIYTQCRP